MTGTQQPDGCRCALLPFSSRGLEQRAKALDNLANDYPRDALVYRYALAMRVCIACSRVALGRRAA